MDGINKLDLITQRVLANHVEGLEQQLQVTMDALTTAQKRITELETPPKAPLPADDEAIDA
ncbi:MAG: hypothetical protein E5V63_04115 [Mesorhizobium sp.]|nr:MAG: hypothetical protein E5V63_04115 [Mesorhizobium sp.]